MIGLLLNVYIVFNTISKNGRLGLNNYLIQVIYIIYIY